MSRSGAVECPKTARLRCAPVSSETKATNPHLSKATAAGEVSDVDVEWDRGNEEWWEWYLSLADNPALGGPLTPMPAHDAGELPDDDAVITELAQPYDLAPEAVVRYTADSFVRLPGVLSVGTVARLQERMKELLDAAPVQSGRFRSLEMMWLTDPLMRAAVLSPRIGGICAALLDADRVRLYHDSALSKEPGAGRTPWHYDAHHFPLDSHRVVSTWLPLQPTPVEMGPPAFAVGAEVWRLIADLPFDKHGSSYDRAISETLRTNGVAVDESGFAAGDISFHSSACVHTAGPNHTDTARMVLGCTYFADGTRIIDSPTMVSGDWRKFVPGTAPGEPVASEYNPLLRQA
jgi:hypothetical protein